MIKYLGHYTQQEQRKGQSSASSAENEKGLEFNFNILLEYSLLDLDEVFGSRLPPVFPNEIEAFWKALFKVADAVDRLHNLNIKEEKYFGYANKNVDVDCVLMSLDGTLTSNHQTSLASQTRTSLRIRVSQSLSTRTCSNKTSYQKRTLMAAHGLMVRLTFV
jgi:hypothetical protein